MSHIGSALTLAEKKLSLKNNKDICVDNSARRAAQATNLSEVTVWRIMAEYNKRKYF
ncbi:Uncharacterized protein dnl_40160 [Desulfonema limicola]|uniref:Uncharacterized protein n=1 Tax=Desulfonema limicola TaxID=45656 RepID=A0A975GI97_9BACT|nr:hypothetical protein [Desulfonema limicola]QTA81673.1 Uncharacterized protein dnl_40160 [Desulfonema limicola]